MHTLQLVSIARDYAIVYYSIFILFGYTFYKSPQTLETFYKILGWVFILHAIWGLFYPFRTVISAISPKLMGITPLFEFRQDADGVIYMGGVLYFVLMAKQYKWPKLSAFLLIFVQFCLILIFQMRAIYVGSFFVFVFLSILKKKKELCGVLLILILIFTLGFISNFNIQGRRGYSNRISAREIMREFISILDPQRSGTASFRLDWWQVIMKDSLDNPGLLFFGRGFGPSLAITSYTETGDWTRENEEIGGLAKSPHNIVITIFARMGVFGLFLWVGFNYLFFLNMFEGIKISSETDNREIHNILVWITGFILMIIGASIFSVLLESPFIAIPYFFFMGLGIAMVEKLKFDSKHIIHNRAL